MVVTVDEKTDILFEMCYFITNTTAVNFIGSEDSKPTSINLRMSQSYFTLKTSDKTIRIIYFKDQLKVFWMLWKTTFKINSYHTMSSNKNFTNNINRIVVYSRGKTYHGTISETQYASGKCLEHFSHMVSWINSNL